MLPFDPKAHWDRIYAERSPLEVSWHQGEPTLSLELLRRSGIAPDRPIIDVGGPTKCIGLEVVQYDAAASGFVLGEGFRLVDTVHETHLTPRGATRLFGHRRFARKHRSRETVR
jgi:hypothetical protein